MRNYSMLLWLVFSNTGDITDYLRYKLFEKELLTFEAGEDFGFDKDNRNRDKGHQVR